MDNKTDLMDALEKILAIAGLADAKKSMQVEAFKRTCDQLDMEHNESGSFSMVVRVYWNNVADLIQEHNGASSTVILGFLEGFFMLLPPKVTGLIYDYFGWLYDKEKKEKKHNGKKTNTKTKH